MHNGFCFFFTLQVQNRKRSFDLRHSSIIHETEYLKGAINSLNWFDSLGFLFLFLFFFFLENECRNAESSLAGGYENEKTVFRRGSASRFLTLLPALVIVTNSGSFPSDKKLFMQEWWLLSRICGEGNGNPLQCSCLENPRDGGA